MTLNRIVLAALLMTGFAATPRSAAADPALSPAVVQRLATLHGPPIAAIPNSDVLIVGDGEFRSGDLNGDGDVADSAIRLYSPGSDLGAPFVGTVLGDPHAHVVGGGVFLFAAERGGVDLNSDGDTVDQGYFFAAGAGPMTHVRAVAMGAASVPTSMTVGAEGAVVVQEVETEFGRDLDGDGSILATDVTMVVLTAGPTAQAIQRSRPIFVWNSMERLGDGSIGGLIMVLPDGRVLVPPADSFAIGHSGDSILTQVPFNQGVGQPPTPVVLRPSAGAPVMLPITGSYQVGDDRWGISGNSICRISPSGVMSPCPAILPYSSTPIDVGNGAIVVWGFDRRHGSMSLTLGVFLITEDGSITDLGPGERPVDLGGQRAYIALISAWNAAHVHIASGGSVGPMMAASSQPGSAFAIGSRVFVDVFVGTPLTGKYVLHEYRGGSLVPLVRGGTTFPTRSWAATESALTTGFLVVGVDERADGADINGDGDAIDLAAMLLDVDGSMTSFGLAIGGAFDPSNRPASVAALGGGKVAMYVRENDQGSDVDGDGTVTPLTGPPVGHWFLYTSESATPTPAAVSGFLEPARLLDTRPDGPQKGYSGTKPTAGQTITLQIAGRGNVPATGVAAVALNLTVTEATGPGFVTVWGDGDQPPTSNLNVETAGQTVPNLVITPVAADGTVRIFTQSGAHVLADVSAWWGSGSSARPVAPSRLLDTRADGPQTGYSDGKPVSGQTVEVEVAGRGGVPSTAGTIVVLNVTATEATGPGFVTVWGDGDRPGTSNLNAVRVGQTVPNLVIVQVGADGKVRIYTQSGTHLIADVMTFFEGGAGVTTGTPVRVLETRPDGPQVNYVGAKPTADQTMPVPVAGNRAAILNVTATEASAPGYVTVWPDGPLPLASNLNLTYAGQTVPNLVLVPVGPDGRVRLYTQSGGHFIVDQLGAFT